MFIKGSEEQKKKFCRKKILESFLSHKQMATQQITSVINSDK